MLNFIKFCEKFNIPPHFWKPFRECSGQSFDRFPIPEPSKHAKHKHTDKLVRCVVNSWSKQTSKIKV